MFVGASQERVATSACVTRGRRDSPKEGGMNRTILEKWEKNEERTDIDKC